MKSMQKEGEMFDIILGNVVNVVDGDTFDVGVTHILERNKYSYNNRERIRIAGIDAPELSTFLGIRTKLFLEKNILGKNVRLTVQSRDVYGRLICKFFLQ